MLRILIEIPHEAARKVTCFSLVLILRPSDVVVGNRDVTRVRLELVILELTLGAGDRKPGLEEDPLA